MDDDDVAVDAVDAAVAADVSPGDAEEESSEEAGGAARPIVKSKEKSQDRKDEGEMAGVRSSRTSHLLGRRRRGSRLAHIG